jgi:hypothetical protein
LRLLASLFAIFCLLALAELGAVLILTLSGVGYAEAWEERRLFLERISSSLGEGATREDRPWLARYELHPFFGFVARRNEGLTNNQGFQSPYTYPYRSEEWEYVIGVFGGSVAQQLAQGSAPLVDLLAPTLKEKGYQKLTVINLAMGASKQPSSFNTFVYFLEDIDLAVSLDGLNEYQAEFQRSGYPASFPARAVYEQLASFASSAYSARDAAMLEILAERAAGWTNPLMSPPLRYSMLAHLAWRAVVTRYEGTAGELRSSLAETAAEDWRGVDPVERDGPDQALDRYFRLYEEVTRFSHTIAEAEGKLFFHFIQPNQYVAGSKVFSEEERALYMDRVGPGFYTERFGRLTEMTQRLRRQGVESHSLTMLFRDHEETLYSDNCCHFNARGVSLLSQAIGETILRSGKLDTIPARRAESAGERLPSRIAGLGDDQAFEEWSRFTSGIGFGGAILGRQGRAYLGMPEGPGRLLRIRAVLPPGIEEQPLRIALNGVEIGRRTMPRDAGEGGWYEFEIDEGTPSAPISAIEFEAEKTIENPRNRNQLASLRLLEIEIIRP